MIWRWGRWYFPFVQNPGCIGLIINIFLGLLYIAMSLIIGVLLLAALVVLAVTFLPVWLVLLFFL